VNDSAITKNKKRNPKEQVLQLLRKEVPSSKISLSKNRPRNGFSNNGNLKKKRKNVWFLISSRSLCGEE